MSSTDTPDAETEAVPEVDLPRDDVVERLAAELGDALVDSHVVPGLDICVRVHRDAWVAAGEHLKNGMGFTYFSFLSGIDWLPSPFGRDMDAQIDIELGHDEASEIDSTLEQGLAGGDTRFQVFARVNDIVGGFGVTLKADLPDDDLSIDSWVSVFAGADWHERECWEMYGFTFNGHPGLRHLYLPGEFEGNPLRKDYPLLARRMKPWPGIVDVEQMPGDGDDPAEAGVGSEEGAE